MPNGAQTAEVCRRHGISGATFCAWKAKFGGMEPSEAKRLKALEDENAKLKCLLAEAMLDNTACEAVAAWTHIYNTERPHSALGYQAPAAFAAELTAMGDLLRASEQLRISPIAPSAQPRQIQPPTLASTG